MWWILKSLIVCSTFFVLYGVSDPFRRPKEVFFIILGLLLLSSCWLSIKDHRYIFKNKYLSSIYIYLVLSFGWYFFIPLVISKAGTQYYNWWTLLPSLNVIIGFLLIHHLVEYTDYVERWVSVVRVICWVSVIISVYGITQFCGYDQFFTTLHFEKFKFNQYLIFTSFGNRMLTANFLACTTPLFLIFRKKKYYLLTLVPLITLILTKSVFNISIAVFGILFVLLLQGKWKVCLIALLIILVIGGLSLNYLNFEEQLKTGWNGRLGMWKKTVLSLENRIWTGNGLGSFPREFVGRAPEKSLKWPSAHNFLIDCLYEGGLVLVILLMAYFINLCRRVKILFSQGGESMLLIGLFSSFICWCLMSNGSFPHRIAPLALIGIIYIAGLEVHLSQRR